MLARRLTPVLALAAVAGFAASGCASQAVGVRVGDQTYSEADMVDELDAWAENEVIVPPGQEEAAGIPGELADSYSQEFVSQILQQRISFMAAEQLFDERGLDLTDGDRQTANDDLGRQFGTPEAVDAFPEAYGDELVDDFARLSLLGEELGQEGLNEALREVVRADGVEVSSQFGEWDEDEFAIVPPEGPRPLPGDGSGSAQAPALPAG